MSGNGIDTFERLDDDKRERILEAAAAEFSDHGFHKASVNRMVGELGIAKGSLFKYFGTKKGLFEYLFHKALTRIKAPLKQARTATEGLGFFVRFRAISLGVCEFVAAHPRAYRIYLKMLFQEDFPLRDTVLAAVREEFADFLGPMVDTAKASGELRPELDREAVIFHLQTLIDRLLQAALVEGMSGGLDIQGAEAFAARLDEQLDIIRIGLAHCDDRAREQA